jgi:hypothetical protein
LSLGGEGVEFGGGCVGEVDDRGARAFTSFLWFPPLEGEG